MFAHLIFMPGFSKYPLDKKCVKAESCSSKAMHCNVKEELYSQVYILVMSCGTPIVYYLGIEENRQQARDHFRARIRIFNRPRRQEPDPRHAPGRGHVSVSRVSVTSNEERGDNGHALNIPGQLMELDEM